MKINIEALKGRAFGDEQTLVHLLPCLKLSLFDKALEAVPLRQTALYLQRASLCICEKRRFAFHAHTGQSCNDLSTVMVQIL